MLIAIYGPHGSGQTTIATKLFDHFDSIGINTHIIHERIHETNISSPLIDIYSILQGRINGIVITDGLEVERNSFVQIEKYGKYYSPDIVLLTSRDENITQMFVTEHTEFEDILKSISTVQNIKQFEPLRDSTT